MLAHNCRVGSIVVEEGLWQEVGMTIHVISIVRAENNKLPYTCIHALHQLTFYI